MRQDCPNGVNLMVNWLRSWNLVWVVITLLVFSLLIKLGLWQLHRGEQKQQRLARIEQLTNAAPINLDELINSSIYQQGEFNDLPVRLTGNFDPDILLLHDNQPNQGKLGYRVYQLFYHQQYSALINLGWVAGSRDRNLLPDVKPLVGEYSLTGNVRIIDTGIMLAEQKYNDKNWPLRVQQIEINKLSRLFSKQLLPFAVYLDKKEVVGYQKNWQPVVMPPEKHHGYAFQWFSLATAWLLLMIWAGVKHHRSNHPNS